MNGPVTDRPAAELLAELSEELSPWLQMCGACDAGLVTGCTHPDGDYRIPMNAALLFAEYLAARLARAEQALADVKALCDAATDLPVGGHLMTSEVRAALCASQGGGQT